MYRAHMKRCVFRVWTSNCTLEMCTKRNHNAFAVLEMNSHQEIDCNPPRARGLCIADGYHRTRKLQTRHIRICIMGGPGNEGIPFRIRQHGPMSPVPGLGALPWVWNEKLLEGRIGCVDVCRRSCRNHNTSKSAQKFAP